MTSPTVSSSAVMTSRVESRHGPDHAAISVPRKAPKQNSAMTEPKRATPTQSSELAASPNLVVLPLMKDMNNWPYSRKPMVSATPATTARLTAKKVLVVSSAGNALLAMESFGRNVRARRRTETPVADPAPTETSSGAGHLASPVRRVLERGCAPTFDAD